MDSFKVSILTPISLLTSLAIWGKCFGSLIFFFGLSGKYEDFDSHQEAYKIFSKSIESIKRKQVEQEFSNGKGDSKKKKFDFHGEMKKFSQEQKSIQDVPNVVDRVQKVVANDDTIKVDIIEEAIAVKFPNWLITCKFLIDCFLFEIW